MSVDDWARWAKRRADDYGAGGEPGSTVRSVGYKVGRVDGATEAFSALLSDEAVEAAARATWMPFNWEIMSDQDRAAHMKYGRAALQAAIDAVTKEARND